MNDSHSSTEGKKIIFSRCILVLLVVKYGLEISRHIFINPIDFICTSTKYKTVASRHRVVKKVNASI